MKIALLCLTDWHLQFNIFGNIDTQDGNHKSICCTGIKFKANNYYKELSMQSHWFGVKPPNSTVELTSS